MDSTKVTGDGLGQFVNDAIACEANCKMKMIQVTKQPQLALYATRRIQKKRRNTIRLWCFGLAVAELGEHSLVT